MGDKEEWLNKLVGKKITESTTDANVCYVLFQFYHSSVPRSVAINFHTSTY